MPRTRQRRSILAAPALFAFALLPCLLLRGSTPPSSRLIQNPPPVPTVPLETILARAADYCRKLEASSFDLACREEISETYNPNLDFDRRSLPPEADRPKYLGPTITIDRINKIKHAFVHDFHCVRAGGTIRETRDLVSMNGRKKSLPDTEIQTSVINFGAAFLGPVGLFGESVRTDYDFAIVAEVEVNRTPTVVLDIKPRPGVPFARALRGRAWIDPLTGDILKLEWGESRAGSSDVFGNRGRRYKRTPRLDILSEFGAERDGIRFPTRLSVEEAYLNEAGKAFVRTKAVAVYADLRFSARGDSNRPEPR